MTKLYIGCSLTGASEEFVRNVSLLREQLKKDYDVLEFLGKTHGTPLDVYEWDIEQCVMNADAMLAIADLPSTGLGWELRTAADRLIPTLIVTHTDTSLSRLIIGAAEKFDNFHHATYSQLHDEVPELLESFLRKTAIR